jgi:Domain of unknown function (DUF5666)
MASNGRRMRLAKFWALGAVAATCAAGAPSASASRPQTAPAPLVRYLGTIKSIKGNTLVLASDEGPQVTGVIIQGARMLRVEPGEKDLSHAVPLELADLEAGDRIRIRGRNSPDSKFVYVMEVIAIKHLDLQAKQERERADWQKRGMGGLVKEVDAAAGTVTLSVSSLGGVRTVTIHTTPSTILRRYAADSVRFDDAKPAPLAEIEPGDQLRARGERSADGSEFSAEEIVSGTFRNIAGTITSLDPAAGRIEVMDLLSHKPVTVLISSKTQLRKLPPEMAMGLAARMRNASAGRANGGASVSGAPAPPQGGAPSNASGDRGGQGGGTGGPPRGPRGDFQQLVNRLPQVALGELTKGEAVILVATGGADSGEVTAITLLGGVEPLLTASPRGSQAFTLSPWTIGGNTGEEGGDSNP